MNQTLVRSGMQLSKHELAKMNRVLQEMRAEHETRGAARDRLRLKQIDSALAKIRTGGYGACEVCKRDIGRERILTEPFLRYCLHCI